MPSLPFQLPAAVRARCRREYQTHGHTLDQQGQSGLSSVLSSKTPGQETLRAPSAAGDRARCLRDTGAAGRGGGAGAAYAVCFHDLRVSHFMKCSCICSYVMLVGLVWPQSGLSGSVANLGTRFADNWEPKVGGAGADARTGLRPVGVGWALGAVALSRAGMQDSGRSGRGQECMTGVEDVLLGSFRRSVLMCRCLPILHHRAWLACGRSYPVGGVDVGLRAGGEAHIRLGQPAADRARYASQNAQA